MRGVAVTLATDLRSSMKNSSPDRDRYAGPKGCAGRRLYGFEPGAGNSTVWAKVRRGISSEPAGGPAGMRITRTPATSHLRNSRIMRVRLGQRRKVFGNLRPIREHSRQ